MTRLLFIPEPIRGVDWLDPSGRAVIWSWIIAAAAAWLCGSLAGRFSGFWEGGGVVLAMLEDLLFCAVAAAIVPAILTWRWYRTAPAAISPGPIRR
ncbi:MAG TPA: hypothetical protein VLA09_05100 [Longimicrobiales bacterium]|nr:hypothetical protein [Longimicrobiales bacterium]